MGAASVARYDEPDVRFSSVSPARLRQIAAATVVGYALLVVTGGAVRLTGSGLGCPDWPTCYAHRLAPQLALHPWVEFGNRLVTVAVSALSIVVFLAACALRERRRDLLWLSGAILGGLLAQIVLGALIVLFHLNPYLVALHFVLTFAVLATALVLHHRCAIPPGRARALVTPGLLGLSRGVLAVLTALVALGTMVTGAGPHGGSLDAKRIPVAFRDIAEVHSTVALFLIGLVLAMLFALHEGRAPAKSQRWARRLFELLVLQGFLGYSQYLLHDNRAIVELHLAGATAVWCAAVSYYLELHAPAAAPRVAAVTLAEAR